MPAAGLQSFHDWLESASSALTVASGSLLVSVSDTATEQALSSGTTSTQPHEMPKLLSVAGRQPAPEFAAVLLECRVRNTGHGFELGQCSISVRRWFESGSVSARRWCENCEGFADGNRALHSALQFVRERRSTLRGDARFMLKTSNGSRCRIGVSLLAMGLSACGDAGEFADLQVGVRLSSARVAPSSMARSGPTD